MFGNPAPRRRARQRFITVFASVLILLARPIAGREPSPGPTVAPNSEPKGLTFTSNESGEYEFDTGILRGRLRGGGKSPGLSSVVHVPSGLTLNGTYGILSHYRVFTTNRRYGTAAWDWPGTSELLAGGAVRITWPEAPDRPFEMAAIYRCTEGSTIDVETVVKARKDLSNFEVFLASYFNEAFPSPSVYVKAVPQTQGKPGFLTATKPFGDWQMFPRNDRALPIIGDGRWKKEPHPVEWKIMPNIAMPIGLRRSAEGGLTAILMAPRRDCFALSTPHEGEGHFSLYLSLFGRDVKAGQTAAARARLVVAKSPTERQILDLYKQYVRALD